MCIEGYVAVDGICKAENCLTYKPNQKECLNCIAGYYLTNQNICKKKPDNCEVVSTNGVCTVCISGYTLTSNGFCVRATDFCDRYDPQTGICLICKSGYYLTAGKTCAKLPENCDIANAFGVCQKCIG